MKSFQWIFSVLNSKFSRILGLVWNSRKLLATYRWEVIWCKTVALFDHLLQPLSALLFLSRSLLLTFYLYYRFCSGEVHCGRIQSNLQQWSKEEHVHWRCSPICTDKLFSNKQIPTGSFIQREFTVSLLYNYLTISTITLKIQWNFVLSST